MLKNERSTRLEFFRMKMLGLSQNEMAEKLGTNRATYAKMEGTGGISEIYLLPLMRLGINLNWLFSGDGEIMRGENNALSEPLITFGGVHTTNNGAVGGDIKVVIKDCEQELAKALIEIGYLKQQIADKELIINLLTEQKK